MLYPAELQTHNFALPLCAKLIIKESPKNVKGKFSASGKISCTPKGRASAPAPLRSKDLIPFTFEHSAGSHSPDPPGLNTLLHASCFSLRFPVFCRSASFP